MNTEKLDQAPLYLAATRPAMIPFLAVPYEAGLVLIASAGLIMIYFHNPGYLLVLLPIWLLLVVLVRHDHNALRVVNLYSKSSIIAIDTPLWVGASPNQAPFRRNKKMPPRGVLYAV
jgi:type IV secretion system protein VirB3